MAFEYNGEENYVLQIILILALLRIILDRPSLIKFRFIQYVLLIIYFLFLITINLMPIYFHGGVRPAMDAIINRDFRMKILLSVPLIMMNVHFIKSILLVYKKLKTAGENR